MEQIAVSSPRLSVVIPTYNRRDSLRITLDGLSRQTYPMDLFEAVVVSDGSTDGTSDMVARFAANCPFHINFIQQDNGGPSRARNRAIEESSGEIIVFLDDDVEPVPDFLSAHARRHESNDRLAVIGPLSPDPDRKNLEPTWITWEHVKLQRIYSMFQRGGVYENATAGPTHFYSGNASVARKWLVQTGGFDLRYTRQEDVELATRLNTNLHVTFFFDFLAVGIHRPSRTFESWLKIPRDYGRLDAQRVVDGTVTYDSIHRNTKNRHPISNVFAKVASTGQIASAGVIWLLKGASLVSSAFGQRKLALVLLSGLYNVVYLTVFENEYAKLTSIDLVKENRKSSRETIS